MDILAELANDRDQARSRRDPGANLIYLATVDGSGEPRVRTLILRDLEGELAIFYNSTSTKAGELTNSASIAGLIYLDSLQRQYRLTCTTRPLAHSLVADSWQLRPAIPKKMDWLYTQFQGQSSVIESRNELLAQLAKLSLPEPLVAPDTAIGTILQPQVVDRLDLNQADGVHARERYERVLVDGQVSWHRSTLVP